MSPTEPFENESEMGPLRLAKASSVGATTWMTCQLAKRSDLSGGSIITGEIPLRKFVNEGRYEVEIGREVGKSLLC